ncbi:alpha-1,3/1,6-mannosyltransferase ALG2-like [Rhynchophorus ferrugineus]|uniref:alpha-1,3/1,6-mannosyltransferase ALG2-like n=1 Tax=Rhynchophorus ferrugineus TaxID=354439 RepID=UPI003FCC952B
METKRKQRIAFIHPDLGIGGAERLVLDVAGALKQQGNDVFFLTNHFDPSHAFEELKNEEFPVEVFGDWLPRKIFGRCQALCAYIRMIYLTIVFILFYRNKYKADLYFIDLIPISIPFLKIVKEKVVYYCHHPDLLASPSGNKIKKLYRIPIDWMEMKATALSDIILVNSEYTASIFQKTFPEIKKPIQILYPTIAASYQESVKNIKDKKPIFKIVPEINSNRDDLFIFLSINRYHPAKRLEFAIDGMEKLQSLCSESEWKKIYLILAGGYDPINQTNKDTFDDLIGLTKAKKLEDKIIFLKSPSDQIKIDLLNSCDVLIYTPLKEHFGIVPLEAMLVGKPVIAMNSGGPKETVEHGVTGYLCDPTAESIAQHMYQIMTQDYKAMGTRGKRRLEEKFSYQSFLEKLCAVVDQTNNIRKEL